MPGLSASRSRVVTYADLINGTGFVDFRNETDIVEVQNQRFSAVWTHQLSQAAFYSIRAAYHDYRRTMRVERWLNDAGYHASRLNNQDRLAAGLEPVWQPGDDMTMVTLEPGPYVDDPSHRYAPFNLYDMVFTGSDRYYENQYDITRIIKGAITAQVSTHHQVKAGVEYNQLSLELLDHQRPYQDELRTHFRKSPWELGLFIQDKLEFEQVIVNLGIRYDAWFIPDTPYWYNRSGVIPIPRVDYFGEYHPFWSDPFSPTYPIKRGNNLRTALAPRIGVSHPINPQAVIYGNYGSFHQLPEYRAFWIGHDGYLVGEEGVAGNPTLDPAKSSQYELGFKQMLTEFLALELTLWGKRTSLLAGSIHVPEDRLSYPFPIDYSVVVNSGFLSASGFECTISKRYSDHFSARVRYSFTRTETNQDYLLEGYHRQYTIEETNFRRHVSRWDRPHRLRAIMSLMVPRGVGPEVLGIKPFERLSAGLTWQASSGWPYTPVENGVPGETYSGRLPWMSQFDLRIYRDFVILGKVWSLFADIRNIADRRNVRAVFADSGRADGPRPGATGWSDHYDRSWYYGTPRTINLGVRIIF